MSSIDKDKPPKDDNRIPSLLRPFRRWVLGFTSIGSVVYLPVLAIGAVTWGVCGRILFELFKWSWSLFGWA